MVHLEGWKAFLKVFQINHPIADQVTVKSRRGRREVTGGRKGTLQGKAGYRC